MKSVSSDRSYGNTVPATPARPCPVCHKPDWCLVALDGSAAICQRVTGEKRCGKAGSLHRLGPIPSQTTDWGELAATFNHTLTYRREEELLGVLNLPDDTLALLPLVGFNKHDYNGPCWTFPEMDA